MKQLISKFLIICLLAISLHGFGAGEHIALASEVGDIIHVSASELDSSDDNIPPALNTACDICQVVHQYMIVDSRSDTDLELVAKIKQVVFSSPPDQGARDILHPPTI